LHSTEAEVREILAMAVKPASRVRMGDDALAALGHAMGLSNEDADSLEHAREKQPAIPLSFE
jgi:plasmid stability protein